VQEWLLSTSSTAETRELGRLLGLAVDGPAVILLCGDLGAGKTVLVQGLAEGLGVGAEQTVTSPSYALMNHYHGRFELYHFDLYRLIRPDDLLELDFDDYLAGQGVTAVEWADRFHLEIDGLRICLQGADDLRWLQVQAVGANHERLLARFQRLWEKGGRHD
jgi:tRNA threonylcarbamoyladenosine biosynthesis protein TsaE